MARCRSRGNASAVIRVGALVGCSARGAHRAARLRSSSVRSLRGAARGRARLARVAPRKGGGGSGASPASGPDELAHWLGAYLGRCPPPRRAAKAAAQQQPGTKNAPAAHWCPARPPGSCAHRPGMRHRIRPVMRKIPEKSFGKAQKQPKRPKNSERVGEGCTKN